MSYQRTLVQGILNVTPDSFSDGGRWASTDTAIAHGMEMIADGVDIIDVGGESTRPGATRPSEDEELKRVVPVVRELARHIPISVDTMRAKVAEATLEAGATIINDVSGGLSDERMHQVVADAGCEYICQHWRGYGDQMNEHAVYVDVVREVYDELARRIEVCEQAGIVSEKIIADPGLGFAKTGDQDWLLMGNLGLFNSMGYRLLIGASRKRFLAGAIGQRPAEQRDAATAAITTICAQAGVWAVRTHEVKAQRDAVDVVAHLRMVNDATHNN